MNVIQSFVLAGATVYGAHVIASAIEYHAERSHPYPVTYAPDENRGCFPTRKEFEEYKVKARQIDSKMPKRDGLPLQFLPLVQNP